MSANTELRLRFAVSLFAYAVFLLKPVYTPSNPWQDFADGSLAVVAVAFLVPVLLRGPGILRRLLAFVVMSPAVWFLSFFLYQLIYDLLHGGRIYADA